MLRSKISDCHGDSKSLHKLVNNLANKTVENPLPPGKSDADLADDFASYFENKILTIREMFNSIAQYESTPAEVPKLMRLSPLSETQVELIVKSMKTKSCKQESILTNVLKSMLPSVLPAITKIVNLSLSDGLFHASWKTATVKPLLKKLGLQLINSNYRLDSNLKFLSKLIEKCMWFQLNEHCLNCNLQPDYQSAYREGFSCEMLLLKLSNNILWSFERKGITSLTSLDLSAVFDMVDHQVLLKMLTDKFGVTNRALHWFEEYLQPRSFRALINKSYSKEIDLKYSVPQGSAAGAKVFNLYCSTL